MPGLTPDQKHTLKTIMEICEAIPHNTKRVYETSTIDQNGEHITHVDREQWMEQWFEWIYDQLGQQFDITTYEVKE